MTTSKMSLTRFRRLGSGGFGVVHLAIVTHVDTGLRALVAVKSADVDHALSLRKEKEWMVQSNFRDCPHLLRCFGDDFTREEDGKMVYNVLLDYCPGGSIADLIKKTNGGLGLPGETVRRYAKSVLLGLKFLHESSNVIHRDIKPDNLLLDRQGELKIADFGLAKKWTKESESKRCKSKKGTVNYMAPETVKEGICGKGVDIWALGCTVAEMITGEMLFKGDEEEIVSKLCSLQQGRLPDFDYPSAAVMTSTALDFLNKCMCVGPTERWTAEMLLQHPFITGREDHPSSSSSANYLTRMDHHASSLKTTTLWPSRRDEELAETLHCRLQLT